MKYYGREYNEQVAERMDMRGSLISANSIPDPGESWDCTREMFVDWSGPNTSKMREMLQAQLECGCGFCMHEVEHFQARINELEKQTHQATLADSW